MATDRCDPTWNHVPRWVLVYVLPLSLLAVCLEMGWIGMSRDFWVPLLFGLVIPSLNTRYKAGMPWALRDFQDRDTFLPTVGLFHAVLWLICVRTLASLPMAVAAFMAAFMIFDYLMVRYRLLCVYALDLDVVKAGALKTVLHFAVLWWFWVGTGFALAHVFGVDTLLAIGGLAAVQIGVTQLGLTLWGRKNAPPRKLEGIRRVAVLGGGWAGMYAVKWLDELGLDVTCFEDSDQIGGLWRYREDHPGTVFKETRTTSSKHFMHASDFPMKDSMPDFPSHGEVHDYLQRYVDHCGIHERFQLETKVHEIARTEKGWRVEIERNGKRENDSFDAVIVCTGPQGIPRMNVQTDPLYRHFDGKIVHAADYKHAKDIADGESVLIVGAGESAADIVAEVVAAGADVHWTTHRGQWFVDRNIGPFAADLFLAPGVRALVGRFLNFEYILRRYLVGRFIDLVWGRGGHGIPEWEPEVPYLHQFLNKSREGIYEVYKGKVATYRAPIKIDGKNVYFEGRDEPVHVDRILLASGYRPHWPFLEDQPDQLFKLVFDPRDPTLTFVGLARPVLGSIPSLAELQTRWIAHVFAGKASLPHPKRMATMMYFDRKIHEKRFLDSSHLGVIVDQQDYSSLLASYVDADVRWFKLLFTNPRALRWLLAAPWLPFKYHLNSEEPVRRREALEHTIRAQADPLHPLHFINLDISLFFGLLLGIPAICLFFFPASTVVAGAAGILFVSALFMRRLDLLDKPKLKKNAETVSEDAPPESWLDYGAPKLDAGQPPTSQP